MKITDNFTLAELTKTSVKANNTPNHLQTVNLCRLCFYLLQPIRDKIARPLDITSAFRSEAVNKAVGGSGASQHLDGMAADVNCSTISKADLFKLIAKEFDYDQCILELDSNCLHVSYFMAGRNRGDILVRNKIDGKYVYDKYTKKQLDSLNV